MTTVDSMLKAQQWELAKGNLRAFVAMQGSYPSGEDDRRRQRWLDLQLLVAGFVKHAEDHGLHE